MRCGPRSFPNVIGYRVAPSVIVELFSISEAMLAPDRLRQLLRVRADHGLRTRNIDFPQQRTRPACQFQALLHLHGVSAIGSSEFLEGGGLAVESLADIHWTELRSIKSAFARPVGPVRGVIVGLGYGSRRQAHLGELGAYQPSGSVGEFFRRTR